MEKEALESLCPSADTMLAKLEKVAKPKGLDKEKEL
jgi:hypothetical protein